MPRLLQVAGVVLVLAVSAAGKDPSNKPDTPEIPFVDEAPKLEEFLDMQPPSRLAEHLVRFDEFRQQRPRDGEPATQLTNVYLCHDGNNLYAVWVAHDTAPEKIRARMTRRDNLTPATDDFVELTLDTFHDQRRGMLFIANPYGIQQDGLWTEGSGGGGGGGGRPRRGARGPRRGTSSFDLSFDTVWQSRGQMTKDGFVVWMSIPFKSLRFPTSTHQEWGMTLMRSISRTNEFSFWPRVSSRIQGRLNQAGTVSIEGKISKGRNIQLIPVGVFRSMRALDTRDDSHPMFVSDSAEMDLGLDSKIVFKDSLVLDLALNPDFSQVESDEPQVTVNQRFEVFFPEKRPFFLENANFFQTPINLVFTRRIADPRLGARLTGKVGRWAVGGLVMDDESPGKIVPDDDPLAGSRALFSIARVSRDLGEQSSIGFIFTGREYEGSYNRVGGIDGRWKVNRNWVGTFQAITSSTKDLEGNRKAGPAYTVRLDRSGRQFRYGFNYLDISPGFNTKTGFVRRTDLRRVENRIGYSFRPESTLISFGPFLFQEVQWDHDGTRLDYSFSPRMNFEFTRQTNIGVGIREGRERLRPEDFSALTADRDFVKRGRNFSFNTNYFAAVGFNSRVEWSRDINFAPPEGEAPFPADAFNAELGLTLYPSTQLRIDNTYLYTRLSDRMKRGSIFNNHIIRSRWNWQFSNETSFRAIFQYISLLTNPSLTDLETQKNLNVDLLFTYLVNPWTALNIGYNSDYQNLDLITGGSANSLARTRQSLLNDSRQFFIKLTYLFRF